MESIAEPAWPVLILVLISGILLLGSSGGGAWALVTLMTFAFAANIVYGACKGYFAETQCKPQNLLPRGFSSWRTDLSIEDSHGLTIDTSGLIIARNDPGL